MAKTKQSVKGKVVKTEPGLEPDEEDVRDIAADIPIGGDGRKVLAVESENSGSQRKKKIVWIVLVLITIIAIAVGIALSVTASGKSGEATPGTTPVPTPSPTFFPDTELGKVQAFLVNNGYSTAEQVLNPSSPQGRAAFEISGDANGGPADSALPTLAWTQRYIMTVFYYSLNGKGWKDDFGFLASEDVCNWNVVQSFEGEDDIPVGVHCSGDNSIDSIIFGNNILEGNLPTELGLLTNLDIVIFLRNKGIAGIIPDDYRNLVNMNTFKVAQASLSGRIPDWIDEWSDLQELVLSENQLIGPLPTAMQNLQKLETLILEDNLLTGNIERAISETTTLKYLIAENNQFQQSLDPTFLRKLNSLEILDLSGNKFSGRVPTHLLYGNVLQVLDLHDNQITNFPDDIPEPGTVSVLALQFNPIADQSFPSESIGNLLNLKHLDLTDTEFSGTMPTILGDLPNLEYLFLAGTSFTAGPIPVEYSKLPKLRDLSLKHSSRSGPFPSFFTDMTTLRLLDLDFNELTGNIPPTINNLKSLKYLLLQRNNLSGDVPMEFGDLLSLQTFRLHGNSLTGDMAEICPNLSNIYMETSSADCNELENCQDDCCGICCDDDNPDALCERVNENDYLAVYKPAWQNRYTLPRNYDFADYDIIEPTPSARRLISN